MQNKNFLLLTVLILLVFVSCTRSNNSIAEVSTDIETIAQTTKEINTIMYVTPSNGLNLRSEPNTTSTIITLLPQNTGLSLVERGETEETIDGLQNYWYKVDTGNEIGWVFGGYLSIFKNEFKADISYLNGTWVPAKRVGREHGFYKVEYSWGIANTPRSSSFDIDITTDKPFIHPPSIRPFYIAKISSNDGNSFILHASDSYEFPLSVNPYYDVLVSFIDNNKILIKADFLRIFLIEGDKKINPFDGTEVWHRFSGPDYNLVEKDEEPKILPSPVLTKQTTPTRTNTCECEYMAINAFPQMLVGKNLTFTEIMVIRTQAKSEGLILENGEVTDRQEVASRVFKALDQPIVTLLFGGSPPERAALVGYLLEMSNNNETHFAVGDRDKKPIYSYCDATGTVVSAQEVYVYAD